MKRLAGPSVIRTPYDAGRRRARVAYAAYLALTAAAALPFIARVAQAADMSAVNDAARVASRVGAGTSVPALGVGAVLQTIVGLLVVIGLVFGCAWLARRFGLQPGGTRGGLVKTVGGASLGGRERVAVVEIGDTWLVLGAAPGNVRLLHTMPAGSTAADAVSHAVPSADAGKPLPGTFGQRFRDALKGEVGKRFNGQHGGNR